SSSTRCCGSQPVRLPTHPDSSSAFRKACSRNGFKVAGSGAAHASHAAAGTSTIAGTTRITASDAMAAPPHSPLDLLMPDVYLILSPAIVAHRFLPWNTARGQDKFASGPPWRKRGTDFMGIEDRRSTSAITAAVLMLALLAPQAVDARDPEPGVKVGNPS